MMENFNLDAFFCDRKSFYGKAKVLKNDSNGVVMLQSYDTIVCLYDKSEKVLYRTWGGESATTTRHVNSFIDYIHNYEGADISGGGVAFWRKLPYKDITETQLNLLLSIDGCPKQ